MRIRPALVAKRVFQQPVKRDTPSKAAGKGAPSVGQRQKIPSCMLRLLRFPDRHEAVAM